jgi:predicted ArsR family transcriptional regulator
MTGDPAAPALDAGFSSAKKAILLHLKRHGEASIAEVAAELRISKMGAWRHLAALEGRGLLARVSKQGRRGRPRVYFRLTDTSARLFPQAYAQVTLAALDLIDARLGRQAVVDLLESRARELYGRHKDAFDGQDLRAKVGTLAKIRDEEGYMAELGSARKGAFELVEHNCPILAIAGTYGEACGVENELFENLLHADVDTTHRVVAGAPVCRFLIRKRPARTEG